MSLCCRRNAASFAERYCLRRSTPACGTKVFLNLNDDKSDFVNQATRLPGNGHTLLGHTPAVPHLELHATFKCVQNKRGGLDSPRPSRRDRARRKISLGIAT